MRIGILWLLGLALALAGSAWAQTPDQTIKIGVSAPLSGDLATYGKSVRDAIVLAADSINTQQGGTLGKKIELVIEDNQSRPEQAKTVFEKLIKRDKVVAIIGDVTSGCTMAAAPVAQENKIPMLTPTATNERVTAAGDYIFRSCFMDSMQGGAMAGFAIEDLKAKNLAVLYNIKDPYSVGLHDAFISYAKAHGATISVDLSYSSGDVDYRGQLTKIKRAKPDAIYAPGYYSEVGLFCRQARGMGITAPFLGSDGWDSAKTPEIGGDSINGCYFTNHYSPEDQRPEVQNFVAAYKSRYGTVPDALAILAYDATYIMADAIKRAGSTDGDKIRQALATTRDFPAATGSITIDANRNALKPICILEYQGKVSHFVKIVKVD